MKEPNSTQPSRYRDAEAVENRPPDTPERTAAKARARQAAAAARGKNRWDKHPLPEIPKHLQPPATCTHCGGTLAQDEHERHPGCQETQTA